MMNSILKNPRSIIPPVSIKIVSLCFLWYSISSLSSQLTKSILNDFPFPLALGECQFLIVFCLCVLTTVILSKLPQLHALFPAGSIPPLDGSPLLKPDRHIIITVLPLGCFQFLGKLFSHSATALVPVSTVAGVKTLSPLILVTTYRLLYNVRFPIATYLSLIPLVFGILLIVVADTHDTLVTTTASVQYTGITYAALSLVVFVAQNIYGKTVFTYNQNKINDHAQLALSNADEDGAINEKASSSSQDPILPLSHEQTTVQNKNSEYAKQSQAYDLKVEKSQLSSFPKIRNKYDKLTLLLYCSGVGFLLSLPWFLYIEAPNFLDIDSSSDVSEAQLIHIPWNLLIVNGLSHFAQSLIAFHLLGAIPTVSYSIASMMKKITIIVVSMIFTGHKITGIQFAGLSLTAAGLYSYDRWGGHKGH
ncbi:putative transporter [Wickerhamomyces ciferrii]|uniref:Transporter n=1 Tax=Wickerhamomyces ciferrii (strain ATCC 14091 / BCRC 22168 / CBS 111 / JCM 3599 / NBRC 0793 / NRRL Y-1031 F-60-10) TaxID=1206466 RepID=K0KJX7_WICCF|nr:putative transporter [Wickerhamomyces ciferrii]CCH42462.1 putative transporter [Wickerhamomyces ciferrii]